jgi:hypothetical protein
MCGVPCWKFLWCQCQRQRDGVFFTCGTEPVSGIAMTRPLRMAKQARQQLPSNRGRANTLKRGITQ